MTIAALGAYLACVWLLTHRYAGIWHDGVFYAGQAIARLYPDSFRNDLFFAYGSQDNYTSFTTVYAWLIRQLGLPDATMILILAAHALWTLTAVLLCRQILRGLAFWAALVLLFALPRSYGAEQLVSYAEGFLTARNWAEPLALLAVALVLRGRPLLAASACAASAACHPIIAMPACLLIPLFHFRRRPLLIATVVAAAVVAALILLQVQPFPSLMTSMDGDWYRISVTRSPFVFVDQWTLADFAEPLYFAAILTIAMMERGAALRRFWRAAFLTGVIGLGIAWTAALSHNALLVQMQAWRTIWLVKVLAIVALVWLFEHRWQRSSVDRAILLGLAASWVTVGTLGGLTALPLAALAVWSRRSAQPIALSPSLARTTWFALLAVALETTLFVGQQVWLHADLSFTERKPSFAGGVRAALAFLDTVGWLLYPVTLLALWRLSRGARRGTVAFIGSAFLLWFSATLWKQDQRQDQQIFAHSSSPREPLADLIPVGSLVYWENAFEYSWFVLHRANYASTHQSAGVIFSRQTAMESERRLARLERLGVDDGRLTWRLPPRPTRRRPSFDAVLHLCQDPMLDFVALTADLGEARAHRYDDPVSGTRYFIYRCSELRKREAAHGSV